MLIFGHTGITLGTTVLLNETLVKRHTVLTRANELRERPKASRIIHSYQNDASRGIVLWLTSLANRIDIRLLLVGSLLPDIIDKPVGLFFFAETLGSGRVFCHTLLFLILINLPGLYLYWTRNKNWLSVLSFGTFTHLILDEMWLTPQTLLWPLYGFSFQKMGHHYWMQDIVVYICELVGGVIVICFVWVLVRRGKLYAFLRKGQV